MMKELSLLKCRLDGRYDVYSRLGRGSYAEIYVAQDILASTHSPHKQVVIKALNVFMQNDLDLELERTLVENFQNEAIALDRVRHPNIISRLGHGSARDLNGMVFHYLALEYLPGGDLAKACRQKGLTLSEAMSYIEQVCAGLGHAHNNGIIHRDIKPQNLLLTADRQTVKIADFGVARITQSDSPITRVGTNMYAPPEHSPMLAGQTGLLKFPKLTPAADIYSLAKSVYVLLTSESPRFFSNQPITELPFAYRGEPWAKELIEVLSKATQSDSDDRHENVIEFWQDISRLKKYIGQKADNTSSQTSEDTDRPIPQPHVDESFNPLAPQKAKFDTTSKLKLKPSQTDAPGPSLVVDLEKVRTPRMRVPQRNAPNPGLQTTSNNPRPQTTLINLPPQPDVSELESETPDKKVIEIIPHPKKTSKTLNRIGIFAALLFIFAGALFATQYYIRNGNLFPRLDATAAKKAGVATTNINLRSEPKVVNGENNNIVGIVTIDSRVKILDEQDNWYQVDIIEYGRPKKNPDFADRGWVYGKYVDVSEN